MALFDVFKKKKDDYRDFMDLPGNQPASYGPAGFPGQGFPPQQQMQGNFPELGMSPPPEPSMGQPFQQMPMQPPVDLSALQRNIETINYKMDSIKAALDAINNRLANIETALRTTPGFETKAEGW